MIANKRVLAIIPARGGSKGVYRKNIRFLDGKPLIAWTIEVARQSKYIDRLILSSEDEEIIKIAKSYNCDVPFVRPRYLAQDTTPGIAPILHALEQLSGYDLIVLLQPTSPFRNVSDIDKSIEKLFEMQSPACVSVTETNLSPQWMYKVDEKEKLKQLIKQDELIERRQELPKTYILNGAVYVAETEWLKEKQSFLTNQTIAFVMPKERSYDIDTEEDFLWCEYVCRSNNVEKIRY